MSLLGEAANGHGWQHDWSNKDRWDFEFERKSKII